MILARLKSQPANASIRTVGQLRQSRSFRVIVGPWLPVVGNGYTSYQASYLLVHTLHQRGRQGKHRGQRWIKQRYLMDGLLSGMTGREGIFMLVSHDLTPTRRGQKMEKSGSEDRFCFVIPP